MSKYFDLAHRDPVTGLLDTERARELDLIKPALPTPLLDSALPTVLRNSPSAINVRRTWFTSRAK